jgi:TNF receptor-associated factor 4
MCSQIYPDPQAEKAIMASVVYCIHHKEGCAWAGELRKLKVSISTPS